jgi:chromosome segregation ATPase
MNDKYVNYYIETLTNTLTDTLLRNISLQVSTRIGEEATQELTQVVQDSKQGQEQLRQHYEAKLLEKEEQVDRLTQSLQQCESMKVEFENTKHQVNHVDTFKNELIKERDAHEQSRKHYNSVIQELKDKIDYLQLTPAKRKKIDEANKPVASQTLPLVEENVKDGGSF